MSIEPEIRRAELADCEKLLPLVQDFVASFELDSDAYSESFDRLIQNEAALIMVAESKGQLVGYVLGFVHDTFYANGPVAWVEEIMVHSEYRRTGLGARLMKSFEVWCKGEGAVLSALATRRASEFYEAIGYQKSATYYRRLL